MPLGGFQLTASDGDQVMYLNIEVKLEVNNAGQWQMVNQMPNPRDAVPNSGTSWSAAPFTQLAGNSTYKVTATLKYKQKIGGGNWEEKEVSSSQQLSFD